MELFRKFWWITAAALVLAASMLYGNRHFAQKAFQTVLHPLDSADGISAAILNRYPDSSTYIMKQQYAIFSCRKEHYKELMELFYTNFYAFSIILVIFSALTTIAFFLLARKGWEGSAPPLKVALLSFVFITSVFYLFSNVMDNKANIRNNLNGYIAASRQQLQILKDVKYLGAGMDSRQRIADSIINNNYDFLYNNLQYFFNIDDTKIANNPLEQLSAKERAGGQ